MLTADEISNMGWGDLMLLAQNQSKELDSLRAKVSELEKRAVVEWLPIETAPKDGQAILLYRPALGTARGCWNDCKYHKNPKPYWTHDREQLWGVRACREDQPTHWMPIPAAPGTTPPAGETRAAHE